MKITKYGTTTKISLCLLLTETENYHYCHLNILIDNSKSLLFKFRPSTEQSALEHAKKNTLKSSESISFTQDIIIHYS